MRVVHVAQKVGGGGRRRGFIFERTRWDGGDGCVGDGGPVGAGPSDADCASYSWRASSFKECKNKITVFMGEVVYLQARNLHGVCELTKVTPASIHADIAQVIPGTLLG